MQRAEEGEGIAGSIDGPQTIAYCLEATGHPIWRGRTGTWVRARPAVARMKDAVLCVGRGVVRVIGIDAAVPRGLLSFFHAPPGSLRIVEVDPWGRALFLQGMRQV